MKERYLVLSQTVKNSRYGQPITEIVLVDIHARTINKTYVDRANRNYANWQYIVQNPHKGYILTNLRTKSPGLITADSRPRILHQTDHREELFSELITVWREQDQLILTSATLVS